MYRHFKHHRLNIVMLVLLTLVAFGLRVIGADSSVAYIPDTQVIRQGLDLGQTFSQAASYNINLDQDYKYPLTLSYYTLGIYGIVFGAGVITGRFSSFQSFEDYLFLNRAEMHVVVVIGFALIAVSLIPAMWLAVRRLNKHHTGWLAAGLATFNLLLVQFGHQARPHVPLAAFAFISIILLVPVSQRSKGSWPWLATLFCAFTLGTLQSGVIIVVPFALAWIARAFNPENGQLEWRSLLSWTMLANGLLLLLLSILLYPKIVNEYGTFALNIVTGKSQYELGGNTHRFSRAMFSLANTRNFAHNLYNYQPILTLLTPIGLPYMLWRLRRSHVY